MSSKFSRQLSIVPKNVSVVNCFTISEGERTASENFSRKFYKRELKDVILIGNPLPSVDACSRKKNFHG